MKRIHLTIDNRARLSADVLDPEALTAIKREFTHKNPDKAKLERQAEGARYNTARPGLKFALAAKAKAEPSTIATWQLCNGELSLPRGGRERLATLLEDREYFVDVDDRRTLGTLAKPNARHDIEYRPYQRTIIDAVMREEQGIARSPTGSGKTEGIIGAMVEADVPSLVVVNETGLLDQWIKRMRGGLGLSANDVGIIGDGKKQIRPVTVATQQTLKNCVREVAHHFGFVACDEVHLFAAKTFQEVIDFFPARYRVGTSADEKRKDQKEFLLYDTIGPVIANVREDALIEAGHILEVEMRLVPTSFDRAWWQDMDPRARGMAFDRLLAEMAEDRERNELVVDLATRVAREQGQQVLVMAHYVDHCRRLLADVAATNPRVGLLVGEDKTAYTKSIAGLMQGSVQIGVGTYAKMSTGIDIKTLGRGVAATPIHLNRQKLKQILGRYCRSAEGKEDAILYVLWDRDIFGLAPVENFKKWANKVSVLDGGEWVDAREYLKSVRGSS